MCSHVEVKSWVKPNQNAVKGFGKVKWENIDKILPGPVLDVVETVPVIVTLVLRYACLPLCLLISNYEFLYFLL